MNKAFIQDNKVYCPKCEQSKYQLTNDYKLVNIGDKNYIEFVARCLNTSCNEKFYFQSDTCLNGTHYAFDKKNRKEVKSE